VRNLAIIAAVIVLLVTVSLQQEPRVDYSPPAAQTKVRSLQTGPLAVAVVGDAVLDGSVPDDALDHEFSAIVELIRGADAAVVNLEAVLREPSGRWARRLVEGGWPIGNSADARILRGVGFDLVARANNHAADHGLPGMQETSAALVAHGLVSAGLGEDLQAARAASYLETPAGRVALISVASSHDPSARAARAVGEIKGRPGLSYLRVTRNVILDGQTFDSLRKSMAALSEGRPMGDDELDLLGTKVRRGDRNHVDFSLDKRDADEVLEQVRAAQRAADVVVVALHAHEPGNASQSPPQFLRSFARAAIDEGADLVAVHGPHQLRAIEVYRGRPIFYSLGNFFFQCPGLLRALVDAYESSTFEIAWPSDVDPDETLQQQSLDFAEDVWWESLAAVITFESDAVTRIELHPVDLGVGLPRLQRGIPRKANGALGEKILGRLAQLSRQFGTSLHVEAGIGVVEPVRP
jgi:poly-gamma-glutamate synthesis protein (capsule biosynthesis protein)